MLSGVNFKTQIFKTLLNLKFLTTNINEFLTKMPSTPRIEDGRDVIPAELIKMYPPKLLEATYLEATEYAKV